jgi:iron complex outermembrane receptor protein
MAVIRALGVLVLLGGLAFNVGYAADTGPSDPDEDRDETLDADLADLDLEGLMGIPVTSVAGIAQPLQDTPAAVHVITAEDIRRGGHRTLADALRMVPGVNVAQITSSIWAISARGFNGRFSTKLLVLIDGRPVYNTLFSGVFWDVQDLVLADVDRIEVVRGPGATLWGANAVNGVINVVTKRARATQDGYATAGGGDEEQAFGTVRYGGTFGEDRYFRVYAKYVDRDGFRFDTGGDPGDDWDVLRGGFRLDFESNPDTTMTVLGSFHEGTVGSSIQTVTLAPPFSNRLHLDADLQGAALLTRVEHLVSADSGWTLQASYDSAERKRPGFFDDDRHTLDVDFRHHAAVGETHELMWGLGYRHRRDKTTGSEFFSFDPSEDEIEKYSAFVQNTMALAGGRASLMLGSKFEDNEFTGFEVQPGVRLTWVPDERRTAWVSVARAVRTPSRGARDLVLRVGVVPPPIAPFPIPVDLVGDDDLDAEELIAYEAGYRSRPTDTVSVDVAAFYNDYDNLISIGATGDPFEVTFCNQTRGESHGAEVSLRWDATERARLSAAYSYLDVDLDGVDLTDQYTSPENQLSVRSYLDLLESLEVNAAAYYVDHVEAGEVPSYVRLDVGLTWRPRSNVDVAVWGQNLLESGHLEFVDTFFVIDGVEVERGVYGQVTVRF